MTIAHTARRDWAGWKTPERILILFVLAIGLTLDAFIYRHVVAIMLAIGIPTLAAYRKAHA